MERLGEAFAAQVAVLQKARETVIALQRLDAEIQKKEILMHCLAGDFSAALGNVVTALRLIEFEQNSPRTAQLLNLAMRSAQEQRRLIDKVLDLFPEELSGLYGVMGETRARAGLYRALSITIERLASSFSEKGVRLAGPAAVETEIEIVADDAHVGRVLENLLRNALDYTPPGSEVAAHISDEADAAVLTIEFPHEDAPHLCGCIFTFATPEPSSAPASRGVSAAALLPDRGGELSRRDGVSPARRWRNVRVGAAAEMECPEMKTIVVIENDALARALVSQCLAGKGWRVIEADNGESGIDLVLKHRPAAVLCDIRTMRFNGFKVCRLIRENGELKKTCVILTTASHFLNDRETAFQSGADAFLVKPILPPDLWRILDSCADDPIVPAEPRVDKSSIGPTTIRFWGVRGSIPTPGPDTLNFGGNTSCVEVRVGGQVLILDAGSGIRRLGQSLAEEFRDRHLNITLLVSHTHWDHIQGFPFFMPAYSPRVNVRILGYGGAVHGLRGALFEQMQSAFFPVGLDQMASHVTFEELSDTQFQIGAVNVRTTFANHPGICIGYRLSTPGGDIVYLPDHEAYERHEVERQKAGGESSFNGLEYARLQDEKITEFMRDADVIIADSQYDEAEYSARRGWGHMCADDTVQLAVRAGAKRLFLFHHDPDHRDQKISEMLARAQARVAAIGSPLLVDAAREGAVVALKIV
jgi:phosphoribosyl 1,2-cyclic phosphodiesterase/ActR/RegA family two-component response regulator